MLEFQENENEKVCQQVLQIINTYFSHRCLNKVQIFRKLISLQDDEVPLQNVEVPLQDVAENLSMTAKKRKSATPRKPIVTKKSK